MAVLRDGEKVLVILRGKAARLSGYWSPLSGTIEAGESQDDALVREVQEEVGLVVRAVAKVWECPTDDGSFRLHWWTADVVGGRLEPDGEEVESVRWVTAKEFETLEPTFAGDREFFDRVLPELD